MTISVPSNSAIPGGESVAHAEAIPHAEAIHDEAVPHGGAISHREVVSLGEVVSRNEAISHKEAISRNEAVPDSAARPSTEANSQPSYMPGPQPGRGSEPGPEPLSSPTLSSLSPGSSGEAAQPRPDKAFVRRHIAHFIAFGGGVGLSRVAPGTAGTLAAFPLFWVLTYFLDATSFLLAIGAMFIIGIWACAVTGKALGSHDHGGMVWDEIVAFLLVLVFTPKILIWQAFAFLLFRVFDIIKPPPIRYYDNKLRGGFGVMFDDILAAFYALLCLAAWKALGI
jgi:phosphatidylglycerophosphatase A